MIGIDPLDLKAMQDHHDREARAHKQEKLQSAILVKVCGDERLRDIVQVFESGDARRKETMWRLAVALGKHSL